MFAGWIIEGDAVLENDQSEQTTLTVRSGDVIAAAKYETIPILKTGEALHSIFLELAESENIKRFCRSDLPPSEEKKIIDISESGRAVQAWYDDIDGTIFWYAPFERVRLNENLAGLFRDFNALKEADFIGIDTMNVKDMSYMFWNCNALTSLNLSSFNTGNVTDMSRMFRYCSALTSLDLSKFDTRNVTDMSRMFGGCRKLSESGLKATDEKIRKEFSTK